jgi:Trypsin-like peptidase domain/von Willebrand factor type A domain
MSHRTGRIVTRGNTIGPNSGQPATSPGTWRFDMQVDLAQAGGAPYFVILHFTNASIPAGGSVKVELGYDVDLFDAGDGRDFWSRPVDPNRFGQKIPVTFTGASGGVTLAEYGSGEPLDSIQGPDPPGAPYGSHTQQDLFLHNSPYVEPIYETRLRCHNPFGWSQAAAASTQAERDVVAATGIIVGTERLHLASGEVRCISSCSGVLIGPDLFLTARHCSAGGEDNDSASVCFSYQTDASGTRPPGYDPHWYKVIGEVAAGGPPEDYAAGDWLILRLDTGSGGIPVTPSNLGRSAPLVAGEPVIVAHHPNGAVKKLQRGALSSPSVTSVRDLDFAGGSSGSALFDGAGNVIGAALSRGPISGPCEVGYAPARTVQDALANPPVQGAPWDVMIVVDRSGSMAEDGGHGRRKLDEARDAASLFVRLIRATGKDVVGLETFSSSATNPADQAPLAMDDPGKTVLVGSAPNYSGGKVGLIQAGGDTSIGDGLRVAMQSFPPPHDGSRRAILLLTDGLQNTPPWIADVEHLLGNTRLFVVGYGTAANLDGALLTRLARAHGGLFQRAEHGLNIRKFFGLTFGGVFQAGALADPEHFLPADEAIGMTIECPVFDETEITAVVGWDNPLGALTLRVESPDGAEIDASSPKVVFDRGRTWAFLRIELPYEGHREGVWRVTAIRDRNARGSKWVDLRYFISVLADGGPKLRPLPPTETIRRGDELPIRVGLHYPDRTFPHADVEVTVTAPDGSLEELVDSFGAVPATGGPDPLSEWAASLEAIEASSGGVLPIPTVQRTYTLYDDSRHEDGGMEHDGVYGDVIDDLTRFEGTLDFHAVATYGEGLGRREAIWSLTVGLDDDRYHVDGGGYEEGIPPWVDQKQRRPPESAE